MKYIILILLSFNLFAICVNKQPANNNTVLVLGDSISIGYTPYLAANLNSNGYNYTVIHPTENCRNTWYTHKWLDTFLDRHPNPAFITWNNGIWDATPEDQVAAYVSYMQNNNVDVEAEDYYRTLKQYEEFLHLIAKRLKEKTSAKIFFVLTTELPANAGFIMGREVLENNIAISVMANENIQVIDLYTPSINSNNHSAPNDVHYNATGSQIFANIISNAITNSNNF